MSTSPTRNADKPGDGELYVSCIAEDGSEISCMAKERWLRSSQKSVEGIPMHVKAEFSAKDWDEAMQKHYDVHGFGEYKPMDAPKSELSRAGSAMPGEVVGFSMGREGKEVPEGSTDVKVRLATSDVMSDPVAIGQKLYVSRELSRAGGERADTLADRARAAVCYNTLIDIRDVARGLLALDRIVDLTASVSLDQAVERATKVIDGDGFDEAAAELAELRTQLAKYRAIVERIEDKRGMAFEARMAAIRADDVFSKIGRDAYDLLQADADLDRKRGGR